MHKKTFQFVSVFLILFLLITTIPLSIINADDPPPNPVEPFIYHYPPVNSFGIGVTRSVNPVFLKDLIGNHTVWNLEYKRYSYSSWTDGNQYFNANFSWNSSINAFKITLGFDAPVNIYHARFTMSFNQDVLDYIEKNDFEVWFNYSTVDGNINLMFNYSDMQNLGLSFSRWFDNDRFFFRFERQNIPMGYYVFDPIFGNTDITGTDTSLADDDDVYGGLYYLSETGTANYLMVYGASTRGTPDIRGLIYYASNLTFVAQTDEITPTASYSWWQLNFSSPPCIGSGWYYLSLHADADGSNTFKWRKQTGGYGQIKDEDSGSVYPNYPNPLTNDSFDSYNLSVYCNYTIGCDVGCTPECTITNPSIANNSVNIEDCRSYLNYTVDATSECDGDIDYLNLSIRGTGVYVNHTNVGNGTYWVNRSGNLDCNTVYYVDYDIKCNDSDASLSGWYKFTTEACCVVSVENPNPSNGSIITNYNVSYLNISYWNNCSCSNTIIYSNLSLSTGNFSNSTSVSEGLLWNNFTGLSLSCEQNITIWVNTSCSDGCNPDTERYWYWVVMGGCVIPADQCPEVTAVEPLNNSNGNPLNLTYNVTISDPDGDNMNYTIECSNGNTTSQNGVGNGTYNLTITNLSCGTQYQVWVNLTTINCSVGYYYFFNTIACPISDDSPELSISINRLQCPCCVSICVTVSDNNSLAMNVSVYSNFSGGNISIYRLVNLSNGTFCFVVCNFSRYDYTYWMNISLDDGNNTVWESDQYIIMDTFASCNTTSTSGGGGGGSNLGIIGIVGLFGFVFALIWRKRREDDEKRY